jgi:MoxR-like ATPase
MDALEKLQQLRRELNDYFIERSEVVDGLLAALLSREHVLLLGPVGTAKSMLAQELCQRIDSATYFGWLLTKFSTPEELFGPISLAGLERDEFRRVTDRKLPAAHIAFLDEIFKSSSAILNSLLAILNERVFHNGTESEPVPLLTLVAASNELPEEGELLALYDRFLLRFQLGYIDDDSAFLDLLKLDQEPLGDTSLSLAELDELSKAARDVHMPEAILQDIVALRGELDRRSIEVSDRRYRKAVDILKAYAFLAGRRQVESADLDKLEHILWSEPDQRQEIANAIVQMVQRFRLESTDLCEKAQQQHTYAQRHWSSEDQRVAASVESLAKLRRLLARADRLLELTSARDDSTKKDISDARIQIEAYIVDLLSQSESTRQ